MQVIQKKANELYEYIIGKCRDEVPDVQTGSFGADMKITLLNDGPFTIILDSKRLDVKSALCVNMVYIVVVKYLFAKTQLLRINNSQSIYNTHNARMSTVFFCSSV